MTKLFCQLMDICLPDYFSGDSRAWICVPVHPKMSFKELRDDLHSELNQGAIGGNNPLTYDNSGAEGDAWFKAAHAAINRDVKPAIKGARKPFKYIKVEEDDDYSVYAYFIFIEES